MISETSSNPKLGEICDTMGPSHRLHDSEWMIVIEDESEEDFEYCTCNACLVGFRHSDEPVCGADEDGRFYIGDQK